MAARACVLAAVLGAIWCTLPAYASDAPVTWGTAALLAALGLGYGPAGRRALAGGSGQDAAGSFLPIVLAGPGHALAFGLLAAAGGNGPPGRRPRGAGARAPRPAGGRRPSRGRGPDRPPDPDRGSRRSASRRCTTPSRPSAGSATGRTSRCSRSRSWRWGSRRRRCDRPAARRTGVDAAVAAVVEQQADPYRERLPAARIVRTVNACDDLRGEGVGGPLGALEPLRLGTGRDHRPQVVRALGRVLARGGLTPAGAG